MSPRSARPAPPHRAAFALALAFALGACTAPAARADLGEVLEAPAPTAAPARPRALRLGSGPVDPETVYVGHVIGATGLPGAPGGAQPWRIGRGRYRVAGALAPAGADNNGYWDWDRFSVGELDSLQGWWPLDRGHGTTGGVTVDDRARSFQALDHGNIGCYTINQGAKRTFGVVGYWHRDPGALQPGIPDTGAVIPGPGVEWTPLGGTASAWCGLRAPGDVTVMDPITGNAYSGDVLSRQAPLHPGVLTGSVSPSGTDRNFPGYGSQWDQMLYRDVILPDGASLELGFDWATAMDTRAVTSPALRVGWFDKDPLKAPAPNDGNYISSTDAGALAPVDSFMVYVGVPVNDAACTYSDGSVAPVADPLRRWFSEVIAIDQPIVRVLSAAGVNPASRSAVTIAGGPGSQLQLMLDADGPGEGGRIRIVFRVKTNRGFDDGDWGVHGSFHSGTAGAAIVDNVVVNDWDTEQGDFESEWSVDNLADPLDAWRATGKPTASFFHAHDVASLPYADPCGVVSSSRRQCNLAGRVVTPGDHDGGERPGGDAGTARQERHGLFGSPTIDLTSPAPGVYNGMGIDASVAQVSGDYKVALDVYTGGLKGSVNGNFWQVAWQSYPVRQANGLKAWSEIRTPPIVSSYAATSCITLVSRGALFDNALPTSNASGVPDSIRFYIQHVTRCFAITPPPAECSPAVGPHAGIYFDNVALAFIDSPSAPPIAVNFWDLFTDAFPANPDSALAFAGGAAFDTCAAHVRTALNTATGSDLARPYVPADTALVTAPGVGLRVDLVFRVLPGVGNYVVIGDRASGLARRPDESPRVAAIPGDGSFWGAYLLDNGAFGTGAAMTGAPGPGHPGGAWDPNVWNSARCDTAERNLFPADGHTPNLGALTPGVWATMLHESDPRLGVLGIVKPRCFLANPAPGAPLDASNMACGGAGHPPAWTAAAGSGFDGAEVPGQPGFTREFTKILPDGQLTPGAHVQYFYRVSEVADPLAFTMAPDTNRIVPQPAEGSTDGHRWQQFGVLPDRWKDPAFGGEGMACMLFVDLADRRGDEREWVAAMDSIGGTSPARRGAHNGWTARPDQDPALGVDPGNGGDPTMAVAAHGGQAGTRWDLFNVRAVESGVTAGSFASRLAAPALGGLAGRGATHGPTPAMLRAFYRVLVLNTGDLGVGGRPTLGPIAGKTDDDVGLLWDFAVAPGGTAPPRTVWAIGRSLAESQAFPGTGHPGFVEAYFGASLRSASYRGLTSTQQEVVDLVPLPPYESPGTEFGARGDCLVDPDVLDVSPSAPGAQATIEYSDPTALGAPPFVAGTETPAGAGHPHRALLHAVRLEDLGSAGSLARPGRTLHVFQVLNELLPGAGCAPLSEPVGVGDGWPGRAPAGYLALKSANPSVAAGGRMAFAVPRTERVSIAIYDPAGRLVRRLADAVFAGGREHVISWDGEDQAGQRARPGVYFWRLRSPSFDGRRKLTLLR